MKIAEAVGRLFQYAQAHQDGFTRLDVETDLGWNRSQFNKTVKRARWWLGDNKTVNLVCNPQGQNELYLYRLVGDGVLAAPWQNNRTRDAVTRLVTVRSTFRSLVSATDGRTNEGKATRYADKALGRLIEDLQDMLVS